MYLCFIESKLSLNIEITLWVLTLKSLIEKSLQHMYIGVTNICTIAYYTASIEKKIESFRFKK